MSRIKPSPTNALTGKVAEMKAAAIEVTSVRAGAGPGLAGAGRGPYLAPARAHDEQESGETDVHPREPNVAHQAVPDERADRESGRDEGGRDRGDQPRRRRAGFRYARPYQG